MIADSYEIHTRHTHLLNYIHVGTLNICTVLVWLMLQASSAVEWLTVLVYPRVRKFFKVRHISFPHIQLFSTSRGEKHAG